MSIIGVLLFGALVLIVFLLAKAVDDLADRVQALEEEVGDMSDYLEGMSADVYDTDEG